MIKQANGKPQKDVEFTITIFFVKMKRKDDKTNTRADRKRVNRGDQRWVNRGDRGERDHEAVLDILIIPKI